MKKKNSLAKKICLCIMCVAFSLFFFACSPITMSTTQYASGQILFEMSFDVSTLSSQDKQKAFDLVEAYHNQLTYAYKKNLTDLFGNYYIDKPLWNTMSVEQRFEYIKKTKSFSNFIACNTGENEIVGGIVSTNTPSIEEATEINVQIAFTTIYGYLAYFCPRAYKFDEETRNIVINSEEYSTLIDTPIMVMDNKTENTFFAKKIVETCSPFYYNKEQPKLLANYKDYVAGTSLIDVVKGEFGEIVASYVFSFTTPYSRLHSDGTIESVEDGTKHTWTFDSLDGSAKVYRNYANQVVYYVIGIVGGLILMAVAVAISISKTKRNKRNTSQAQGEKSNPCQKQDEDFDAQQIESDIPQTPNKINAVDIQDLSEENSSKEKENSDDKKKTKRRTKKVVSEKDIQNLTGIELLKAIDDLVNDKGDKDEKE